MSTHLRADPMVTSASTRARQRIADLLADPSVRHWRPTDDGSGWIVRWVGDEPAQTWRRVDREWAERVEGGVA